MPLHDFICPNGHQFEKFQPANTLREYTRCTQRGCTADARKVFLKAPMGFVQQDVHYTSPVDGRPITNWQEHLEELARTDTVVYEPGIKQDQERNQRMREETLERSVDETVEREVETMPVRKREKLAAELEGGITAEPVRGTPAELKPILAPLEN